MELKVFRAVRAAANSGPLSPHTRVQHPEVDRAFIREGRS
jgi:hypothetical protein